jgi:hypothetical protein
MVTTTGYMYSGGCKCTYKISKITNKWLVLSYMHPQNLTLCTHK